eukprot:g21115.t1
MEMAKHRRVQHRGGILWETLLHINCDDIPANLASGAVRPFACGIERSLWTITLLLVTTMEGYCLFILHCYCEAGNQRVRLSPKSSSLHHSQDVMVSVPTKAFEDLYNRTESHFLAKHLNPYDHLYGALPGQHEIAGEAVMAGVPMGSTYQLFGGTFHTMSFPPRH